MNTTTLTLKRHGFSTFSKKSTARHGGMADKNIGEADAANRTVHVRMVPGWVPLAGMVNKRNVSHEVEHLTHADFTTNADHHDDERWVKAGRRKAHSCGRSYSWKGFFTTKHLSQSSLDAAKRLLKDGRATVVYQKDSLLDKVS